MEVRITEIREKGRRPRTRFTLDDELLDYRRSPGRVQGYLNEGAFGIGITLEFDPRGTRGYKLYAVKGRRPRIFDSPWIRQSLHERGITIIGKCLEAVKCTDPRLVFIPIEKRPLRQSVDEYFLAIAKTVSSRSTCRRHQIGAVSVKDRFIISTGYNGAASGAKDCLELGCLRDKQKISSGTRQEVCRAIHAEQNVIIQARASLVGATVYCTHSPCILCAKMLANAKIERLVCSEEYSDIDFKVLFKEVGIDYALKGE